MTIDDSIRPGHIIDAHLHVASTRYLPTAFMQGVVENSARAIEARTATKPNLKQLLDLYLKQLQDHDCSQLLQQMDDANIDQAVLLLPDYTYALTGSELSIEEMFKGHHQLLQNNPDRFYVFAGVDPRWGKEGIDLFEKGVKEYGFKGLKIYPPCGYSPSDPSMYPFYEICQQQKIPVLMHVGGTSPVFELDMASPILVDKAARDFGDVNFILAHGAVAYTHECVMLASSRANIYIDISTYQKLPVAHLNHVFSKGINHKIIFGTDWPIFRMKGQQKNQLDSLFQLDSPLHTLEDWEVSAFFSGTIKYLMGVA